jgi:hypothetical protein
MRRRYDRPGGRERVRDLEEGVGAPGGTGAQIGAEPPQGIEGSDICQCSAILALPQVLGWVISFP